MFIMSYISLTQLNRPDIRLILLLILYSSALVSALLWKALTGSKRKVSALSLSSEDPAPVDTGSRFDFKKVDKSIMDAFDIITRVGGYVILFSISAQIFSDIGSHNGLFKLLILGFLEITTGINKISTSALSMDMKIALITMITAFGGLSGMAQTNSVISNTRLSIHTYMFQKLLHMIVALIMAAVYVYFT
jgi:hypothetical protein